MPPAPKQIGRFEVRSEIGRGSNGVVYAAFDPILQREVAIKAIPLAADNQARNRAEASFLQEAKSAAGLNHPGIVTVFDAGKTDSVAYIAMERLYGNDLHDWLTLRSKLAPRSIASMMARVADAVHYAHRRGLIHRDLKPSNIFLTRDNKPKVLDFGVAMALAGEAPPSAKRQLIGTPNYMSPEQALGRPLDARSDVFSIGSILYELLTGQRAFDGRAVEETLSRVAGQQPAPIVTLNAEVSVELVQVVERAMAKDPDKRYQSAAELRNDLVAVASRDENGRRATLLPLSADTDRPNLKLRYAIGALGLVAAVAVVLVDRARSGHPDHAAGTVAAAPPAPAAAPPPVPAPAPAEPKKPARADAAVHTAANARPAKPARPPVRAAQPAEAPAAPAPAPAPADGAVVLGIVPWGEIVVDGASHGVSPPLTRLSLPAGAHTIEVRNGSTPAYIARIDLQPGQSVEIKHRF